MAKQTTDDMNTGLTSPTAVPPAKEPTWLRRRWRRLVPIGMLAAAAAVAAAEPTLGGSSAFASWTVKPEPLTGPDTAAVADTCRTRLGMPDGDNQTLLAERRGGWTYVFISAPVGEATCLMRNAAAGQDPEGHEIFADLAEPTPTATVDPRQIVETGSTGVSTDEGWFRRGWLTWTYGYAGNDVTSVTVRTPLGTDVEATVRNGRFAAWWPSERPSSKHPEVMGAWHYTVTLSDGSTQGRGPH